MPRLIESEITHGHLFCGAGGHDGGLYRGAGASYCGPGTQGRLLFAWALDPALREPLRRLAHAAAEREDSR